MAKSQYRNYLTESGEQDVKERYIKLEPMISIAESYGVTRQCIYKALKRQGVDTSKAQRVIRSCNVCGAPVLRRRGMARRTKHSYCSMECYMIYLESLSEGYQESRYHGRLAQHIIANLWLGYDPKSGHIIHHVNKDQRDNRLVNLWVFANQSDHLKHHRGIPVTPIWQG